MRVLVASGGWGHAYPASLGGAGNRRARAVLDRTRSRATWRQGFAELVPNAMTPTTRVEDR